MTLYRDILASIAAIKRFMNTLRAGAQEICIESFEFAKIVKLASPFAARLSMSTELSCWSLPFRGTSSGKMRESGHLVNILQSFLLFSVAAEVANTCLLHFDRLLKNKKSDEESSTDHTHIRDVIADTTEEALLPDVETTSAKGRSD